MVKKLTRRPRVLIFSLAYFPFVGGAEVAVKEITDRLPGYEFELLTANLDGKQKKEEEIGAVKIIRIGSGKIGKYFFPLTAYRGASRRHKIKPYDMIWAIMANQAGTAGALFKARFRTVPFLLTLQEGDELNSLAYRLRLLIPKFFGVFRSPNQIQVISNYLGEWARAMGAKCPITVVPNGVNIGKFKVQNEKLKETTKNFKTIITTSRLVKKNGVDTLIESLKFLPENVKLQILGTGQEEMSLRQLMSRHRLDSRVEFLGHVAPDKVAEYLVQADIFARPSRSEGLGNSFLEAMAAGVPTIGTPVGGIPDFLQGDTLAGSKVSPLIQTGLPRQQRGWVCEVNNA